jgi:hypothetical protein
MEAGDSVLVKDVIRYSWKLVKSFDLRTTNSSATTIVSTPNISCSEIINKKAFEDAMRKKLKGMDSDRRWTSDFKIQLLEVKSPLAINYQNHKELYLRLSAQKEKSTSKVWCKTFNDMITVVSGNMINIYQLVVEGPGIFSETDVYHATLPCNPFEPAEIEVTFELAICRKPQPYDPGTKGCVPPGTYALKSYHGTFIRAHPGGEGSTVDLQITAGQWGKWTLVEIPNSAKFSLRSAHGTYLRAHPGGKGAKVDLQVDENLGGWEQFVVVPATNGKYGIRSAHGTFLRAFPGGEGAKLDLQVDKNDWAQMPWEQFNLQML